jgi:hypothetical protein
VPISFYLFLPFDFYSSLTERNLRSSETKRKSIGKLMKALCGAAKKYEAFVAKKEIK